MNITNGGNPLSTDSEEWLYHTYNDPHLRESSLSDIILGGQDGLVNVLGVILGVATVTVDSRVVLVAGLAAMFAESISMAAVAYTSTQADAEYYESEREREYRHIRQAPQLEREEVHEIFRAKGFEGELLENVVNTITADEDAWVQVMMSEEHGLAPITRQKALRSTIIVGLSAIVGSLIPLAPFLMFDTRTGMIVAILISALVLFLVGAYKGRMTIGRTGRSGLEMALIGTISALAGFGVGLIFNWLSR